MSYSNALYGRTLIYMALLSIALYIYAKKIPKTRKMRMPMIIICIGSMIYFLLQAYMNTGFVKALDSFATTNNVTPVQYLPIANTASVTIDDYDSNIVGRSIDEIPFISEILLEEAGQIIYTSEGTSYIAKLYEIKPPTDASLKSLKEYTNGENFYQRAPDGKYYIEEFGHLYLYVDETYLARMIKP